METPRGNVPQFRRRVSISGFDLGPATRPRRLLRGRAFAPGDAARVIVGERGAAKRLERAVHRPRFMAELAGTAILLPPVRAALPPVHPAPERGVTWLHLDAANAHDAAPTAAAT